MMLSPKTYVPVSGRLWRRAALGRGRGRGGIGSLGWGRLGCSWRGFNDLLDVRQALVELASDHLVHVHEHAHRLANEIVLARHDPGHFRLVPLGPEDERGEAGIFH